MSPRLNHRSEDGELPYEIEWNEASDAVQVLGHSCVSMLAGTLHVYLETWEQKVGIKIRPEERKTLFRNRRLVKLGAAASQLCQAASKPSGDAYRSGKSIDECPFAAGTLESAAWVKEWECSLRWRRDLPDEARNGHYKAGVERITSEIEPFRKFDPEMATAWG